MAWLETISQIEEFEDAEFDAALVAEMEQASPASVARMIRFSTPHLQGVRNFRAAKLRQEQLSCFFNYRGWLCADV